MPLSNASAILQTFFLMVNQTQVEYEYSNNNYFIDIGKGMLKLKPILNAKC